MPPSGARTRELACSATFLTKKSSSVSRIGIQRHELRAAGDEIAEQQLGRGLERQLERIPVLAEQRDALHPRAMALEQFGRQTADDELPAPDLERLEIGDPPARHEPAARQNGHAAAQRFGVRQHVRAEEHRASAIAQRQNEIAHFAPAERIETRHRLVEKHDFGIVDQRLGDADALQHALRELAQLQPPLAGDADLDRAAPTRAGAAPRRSYPNRLAK